VKEDPIALRGPEEVAAIGEACRVVHAILAELHGRVVPGVSTGELDALAEVRLAQLGAQPAFKGYHGFPACICISVNEEIVHGIPGPRRLQEGDLVSLDFGAVKDGWYGDAAVTVAVGVPAPGAARLLEVTAEALARGVAAARPGARLGDLGAAVQGCVEAEGFSVVRDFVGHGIGRALHEPPAVPNFGVPGTGILLRPGMVLAIEPMVTAGRPEVELLGDGWTAISADRSLCAHFEHTIVVTESGPLVLGAGSARWNVS